MDDDPKKTQNLQDSREITSLFSHGDDSDIITRDFSGPLVEKNQNFNLEEAQIDLNKRLFCQGKQLSPSQAHILQFHGKQSHLAKQKSQQLVN